MKTIIIFSAALLASAGAQASLGQSLGSGLVVGTGTGLATGSTGAGLAVGAGSTLVGLGSGCSPADIGNNVDKTEMALMNLAGRQDFETASTFKAELVRIKSMSTRPEKLTAMYQMAGVNPNSQEAIIDFLKERDHSNSPYADVVRRNLRLDQNQARQILDAVNSAIVGDLQ